MNETEINEVVDKSYIPTLKALLQMIERHKESLSSLFQYPGVGFWNDLEIHAPSVIDLIQKIHKTGCCEILSEPYSHGLSSLASTENFKTK